MYARQPVWPVLCTLSNQLASDDKIDMPLVINERNYQKFLINEVQADTLKMDKFVFFLEYWPSSWMVALATRTMTTPTALDKGDSYDICSLVHQCNKDFIAGQQ